jgi:hypothetical protein
MSLLKIAHFVGDEVNKRQYNLSDVLPQLFSTVV